MDEDKVKAWVSKIDELVKLSEQQIALYKEMKQAILYERATHDIRKDNYRHNHFYMFDKQTKKAVYEGNMDKMVKYINTRNIDPFKVYGLQISDI